MAIAADDRSILRALATRVAEIAALPIQAEKRELWRRLNRLDPVRPMVWINETPWDELKNEPDLAIRCQDEFCIGIERRLRWELYCWDHMRADMVMSGEYPIGYRFSDTGFGVTSEMVHGHTGKSGFGSHDFLPIMRTEADIDRIRTPVITPDRDATDRDYSRACELIGDLLVVKKRGVVHQWHAPWDIMIQWYGIQEMYTDFVDRPEFVHKAIGRLEDALIARLDQMEAHGLLDVCDGNHRVGSGGLGITDELPQKDYDGKRARPIDQWGSSTGQIMSEVSPAMHDEFCLQYELRWLERHGLNCYGCCEPLHNKMDILKQIPRLRRISMSTWIDIDVAASRLGRDYIFSYKPNPAVFAWNEWNVEEGRRVLRNVLDKTRGCVVELIMKDVSTVRNDPRRLTDWCDMAVRTAEEYAY